MENATKALMITAGVLMGILILSLGVYLYATLSDYVSEQQSNMEMNANNKFNAQFYKYVNMTQDNNQRYKMDFEVTIQDIITVANLAYENNLKNNLTVNDANENTLYVTVYAKLNGTGTLQRIEDTINEKSTQYLNDNNRSKYQYKCYSKNIKVSNKTGRVYEITFE